MRVLVVDDDAGMRLAINEVLVDEGLTVDVAADGRQAPDRAGQARPALVSLDITLPIMDGYAVAEAVRANGLSRARHT